MKYVDSVAAARQLATDLNSTDRTTPIAVVSTPAGRPTSLIDAKELHDEVGDLVPVYLMASRVSWAFSEQMPDLTQVYGGAGARLSRGCGVGSRPPQVAAAVRLQCPRGQATPGSASEPRKPGPRPTAPPADATIARLQADLREVADELRHTQAEAQDLRTEHRLLLQERTKATNRANHLQGELAEAKQELRKTRRQPAGGQDGGARFHDPEDQFRHDVYVARANRMTPDDKEHRRLAAYVLGPRFLDSVAALQGITRSKIVDVVVETHRVRCGSRLGERRRLHGSWPGRERVSTRDPDEREGATPRDRHFVSA